MMGLSDRIALEISVRWYSDRPMFANYNGSYLKIDKFSLD